MANRSSRRLSQDSDATSDVSDQNPDTASLATGLFLTTKVKLTVSL